MLRGMRVFLTGWVRCLGEVLDWDWVECLRCRPHLATQVEGHDEKPWLKDKSSGNNMQSYTLTDWANSQYNSTKPTRECFVSILPWLNRVYCLDQVMVLKQSNGKLYTTALLNRCNSIIVPPHSSALLAIASAVQASHIPCPWQYS